ncbi:MAG: mannitol dehydrogenase family protein [Anaerolineae bacterium]
MKAMMFGAGNIGRGFLGQLFAESGYKVVFVDIDEPLIGALRDNGVYPLRLVTNANTVELKISPVTGILSKNSSLVAESITQATIGATAVGARALPYIAPTVAAGVASRMRAGVEQPFNLIVCENLKGAAALFRTMVCEHLNDAEREYLASHVGFVDTVIGRMVPELSPELKAQDRTLVIAEPYKELPVDRAGFIGPIPNIVGMEPCDNFSLYTARKLYLHNAGHAILAYLGYRRGYQLGYEALEDKEIRLILDAALEESLLGIVMRYHADETWLRTHVDDLKERFANRVLADPVLRLGRDPLRKLAPDDRLVGAARTAETTGYTPLNLAWGIAAGLVFDAPGDDKAVEMQKRIAQEGIAAVMESVCAIKPNEPLGQAVLERYSHLQSKARWR